MSLNEQETWRTVGDLRWELPLPLQDVRDLELTQKLGEHARLTLCGLAPDTLKPEQVERVAENASLTLRLHGEQEPLFYGICESIELRCEGGLYKLKITALSHTAKLDVAKTSRSYQQLNISYDELAAQVLRCGQGETMCNELPFSAKYERFAVQYWETDWMFLKRIAARAGTVLVADKSQVKPRFYLGLPNSETVDLARSTTLHCGSRSREQERSERNGKSRGERFLRWHVTDARRWPLGQRVRYDGKLLRVAAVRTSLEQGSLCHRYELAAGEAAYLAETENKNLRGVLLPGTVLESGNVHSKLQLHIDERQDRQTALWFPYATPSDNFMYCMPHNGEAVNLYFRDGWEENAIAVSAARKNGASCKKTGDYRQRYFSSHERKELYLGTEALSFTADEQAADKIQLLLNDAGGIELSSAKHIGGQAKLNLRLLAEKEINVEAQGALYLICGDSSILLKEEIDISGCSKVALDGEVKQALGDLPAESTLATTENAIDNFMEKHPYITAGLSLVPGVGSAIDAYDAYKCFKNGDIKGGMLSAGSALLGLAPGGKAAVVAAKTVGQLAIGGAQVAHARGVF